MCSLKMYTTAGMEVASHLATLGICGSITVVGRSSVPYEASLGRAVGARLLRLLEGQGVEYRGGETVEEIKGDQRVEKVRWCRVFLVC